MERRDRLSVGPTDYEALRARIERSDLAVNSLVLRHEGRKALELYRPPYRAGVPQLLYSLSKSFTSIAVGIACDLGLLSLDDTVVSFFPDKRPADVSLHLSAMRVRHLLSMTAGHGEDIYPCVTARQDWARAFLEQKIEHVPGTFYRYSTPSSYMLAAIVERVSGRDLVDFLMPALFGPLGITRPDWERCPLGVTAGGMGLSLSTEDTAKFGQMLLSGGMHEGKRIVSAAYIELASSEQSDNRTGVNPERIDSAQGYGFQFHRCRFGAYRGDGSFGQLCLISPKHDLAIAANCAFPSMRPLQKLLDLIFAWAGEDVGGAAADGPSHPLREAASTGADVQGECGAQDFGPAASVGSSRVSAAMFEFPAADGTVYELDDNPDGLRSVRFGRTACGFELTTDYADERSGTLPFDISRSIEAEGVFVKDLSLHRQRVVTSVTNVGAAGDQEQPLRFVLRYIETPYEVVCEVGAAEDSILWSFAVNVSFGFKHYAVRGRPRVVTEF